MFDIDNLERLPRDVSPREYFRGGNGDRDFVTMRYPNANDEHRKELLNFIHIGSWLADNGIKSPELYDLDIDKCIASFEDLGSISFGKYLKENPKDQKMLYILAVEVLKKLSVSGTPDNLPAYKDSKIHKNRRQIVDYYIPFVRGRGNQQSLLEEYLAVWNEIERSLPPCPQGFIHGDYHLENLMYMAGEQGIKKCALIDYQDALYGALPYDLVNLLEDARIDIPDYLRTEMIDFYCEAMSTSEKAAFLKGYRVLGTQFHCRVIGLFIKLSAEQGRDAYLVHINRLQNYIKESLKDPLLSPLKLWFEKEKLDFTSVKHFNGNIIRKFFDK